MWIMRACLFVALLINVPALTAQCPQGVSLFFPNDLAATAVHDAKCVSVNVSNRSWTVAAFSNGFECRLRVFDGKAIATGPIYESSERLFGDLKTVTAVDINGNGVPEIAITSSIRGNDASWIFSLDAQGGAILRSPGPDAENGPLTGVQFVDTTGTGVLDVIDVKSRVELDEDGLEVVTPVYTLYRVGTDGTLVRTTDAIYFAAEAARVREKPTQQSFPFVAPTAGQYRMSVFNGAGGSRCTSALVSLNGEIVFDESDFKRNVYRISKTVMLQTENTALSELRSGPGCSIFLLVDKDSL